MVSLRMHCQQTLRACGADTGTSYDAVLRALPYVLRLSRHLLVESKAIPVYCGTIKENTKDVDEAMIRSAMCAYLHFDTEIPEFEYLPPGLQLMKLGLKQLWREEKCKKCSECQRIADG